MKLTVTLSFKNSVEESITAWINAVDDISISYRVKEKELDTVRSLVTSLTNGTVKSNKITKCIPSVKLKGEVYEQLKYNKKGDVVTFCVDEAKITVPPVEEDAEGNIISIPFHIAGDSLYPQLQLRELYSLVQEDKVTRHENSLGGYYVYTWLTTGVSQLDIQQEVGEVVAI